MQPPAEPIHVVNLIPIILTTGRSRTVYRGGGAKRLLPRVAYEADDLDLENIGALPRESPAVTASWPPLRYEWTREPLALLP